MDSQQIQDAANLLTIAMAICFFLSPLAEILISMGLSKKSLRPVK